LNRAGSSTAAVTEYHPIRRYRPADFGFAVKCPQT
jgi:hypothetical protein